MRTVSRAVIVCVLLSLGVIQAAGQSAGSCPLPPHVVTTGEATASASPDQAKVDVGVLTQAPTARQAGEANARQSNAVLAALRKELGSKAEIKTVSYSVNPEQRYPRDGGQPTITGYRAVNVVQVTVNELEKVGPVVDRAVAAGANEVRGIRYSLRDEQALRVQALAEATKKARAGAQAIAAALGARITRVLSVTEGGEAPPVRPMMRMAAMAEGAPTPVEPGTIELHVSVSLTAEIAQ